MKKLTRQYYMTVGGEKKLNCYHINLSKELIKEADIKETDDLNVYAKDGKIIIEKVK